LNRRSLLKAMLMTPLAARAPAPLAVAVIGAGAAGLAAARALADSGRSVAVIEARNRIGGRLLSDRSLGLPLDMGASWIHGQKNNPLTALARQFSMATLPTDYDNLALYDRDGKRVDESRQEGFSKQLEKLLTTSEAYGETLDRDRSLQAGIDTALNGKTLGERERRDLAYMLNTTIEHEFAADTSELSLWYWDEGEAFGGGDLLLPNGYDQIASGLARGLDLRLG
jgi:phytoene dehydrogenase-like protein